jgi:hypothetical protein
LISALEHQKCESLLSGQKLVGRRTWIWGGGFGWGMTTFLVLGQAKNDGYRRAGRGWCRRGVAKGEVGSITFLYSTPYSSSVHSKVK